MQALRAAVAAGRVGFTPCGVPAAGVRAGRMASLSSASLASRAGGGAGGSPAAPVGLRALATASASRIPVDGQIVDMNGDEMTRHIWFLIREKLVFPHVAVESKLREFDLGLPNRDATDDQVTLDAAAAILECNVGVKCATITPDAGRVKEFGLKKMYRSPNGQIRGILNGTVFREPILCSNVPRIIPGWKAPIIVGRHAYADQYACQDMLTPTSGGKLTMRFEPADGGDAVERTVFEFGQGQSGIALTMYNTDDSIRGFARSSFLYARSRGMPLYLATKNTILKVYDGRFADIFAEVGKEFPDVQYEMRLIDDMVAQMVKNDGGYVLALKNYDGDVQSDIVAQGYGSLGLMTSVLLHPDGKTFCSEAAHGTVTRHWRKHQAGEATSTNSIASIFAWSRALSHRGRLDGNDALVNFGTALEAATIGTVEGGVMTKDLAICVHGSVAAATEDTYVTTEGFIDAVATKLSDSLAK